MTIWKLGGLAVAAMLVSGVAVGQASAMRTNGLKLAATQVSGNVQHVRYVCGTYRCWWTPGAYWGHRYYGYRWGSNRLAWNRYGWRRPLYAYAGQGYYGWRRPLYAAAGVAAGVGLASTALDTGWNGWNQW